MDAAFKRLGYADRPVAATDIMTVAGGIFVGGLIGSLSFRVGACRYRPPPVAHCLWANTLNLNVFLAIVGPGIVAGCNNPESARFYGALWQPRSR
jgi:hypothetical protein